MSTKDSITTLLDVEDVALKNTASPGIINFFHRVTAKIIDLLRRRSSLKAVAENTGTSLSGVTRVLNALAVPGPEALPEAISFDEFKPCRRMLPNWQNYILNAFDIRLSNGFTEGCNNAIKTLKRASFGCRTSHASVREFCYPSLYTPIFDTEPL